MYRSGVLALRSKRSSPFYTIQSVLYDPVRSIRSSPFYTIQSVLYDPVRSIRSSPFYTIQSVLYDPVRSIRSSPFYTIQSVLYDPVRSIRSSPFYTIQSVLYDPVRFIRSSPFYTIQSVLYDPVCLYNPVRSIRSSLFYTTQSPFITKKYTVLYTQQHQIQIKSSNDQGIYNIYQQMSIHKGAQRSKVSSAASNSFCFVSGHCAGRWWFAVWIAWHLSWSTSRTAKDVEENDGRRQLHGLRHCCSPQNSYLSSGRCPGWSCNHSTSAQGRLFSWSTLFPCSGGLGENLLTRSIVFVSAHPNIHGRLAPGHWLQIDIEMEL